MSNYASVGLKVIHPDMVFIASEVRVTLRSSSYWFRGSAQFTEVFEYIYCEFLHKERE